MIGSVCHVCPFCQNWQVDYSVEDLATYMDFHVMDGDLRADFSKALQRVEDALRDHMLDECPNTPLKYAIE